MALRKSAGLYCYAQKCMTLLFCAERKVLLFYTKCKVLLSCAKHKAYLFLALKGFVLRIYEREQ